MDKSKKKTIQDDYGKTVKELRDQRQKSMMHFYAETHEMTQICDAFNGVTQKAITYEDLSSFDLFATIPLNENVDLVKVHDDGDKLIFETNMKKYGEFGWHFHDCVEVIDVIAGVLFDGVSQKTLRKGDQELLKIDQKHRPIVIKEGKGRRQFSWQLIQGRHEKCRIQHRRP